MSADLTIEQVTCGYDKADVLHGVSLEVRAGTITCLLGGNGSGKTTLVRAILGLTPPRQGSIRFAGTELVGLSTHRVIAQGIGAIPEGRRLFPKLTVEENLRLGGYLVNDEDRVRERLARVYALFPRLEERRTQLAGTMSGGEQAMVSIGRGLMGEPRVLLIDEPSLGLSPLYVKENFNIIRRINEAGITVFLVEQNAKQTLAIAHFGYVLSQGRVVAAGQPAELMGSDEVHQAYFG
ncbi:MAG TPA: ABC transporter ATP-binding protein [Azospirillum sp.]